MTPDSKRKAFVVTLQPVGRRIEVEPGTNLLEAAQRAGVDLIASCGGIGICGTCRVRIAEGQVTAVTLTEAESLDAAEIAQGYRLACQAEPRSDVRLEIPPESLTAAQQMQIEGRESELALNPAVVAVDLQIAPPELDDLRGDVTRVNEALEEHGFAPLRAAPALYSDLSETLRRSNWRARLALRRAEGVSDLAAVLPAGAALAGLAIDIGSTKLALYLVDLESGATLARTGVMNPQISYGEDVVSRIAHANRAAENRLVLQERLVQAINEVGAELCAEAGLRREQVVEIVAVGNTAIHHLFCGLPVEQLGAAPYVPVVNDPLDFLASAIGLQFATGARVFLPANIAGYVGADHVSALLASQSYAAQGTTLLVDIGTNTEVSLTHAGQVYSCSCASGPAFEGAHIHDGMRAAPGAVDRVHIDGNGVSWTTIAGAAPVGICGSGILNAVSAMLDHGILDRRGVLQPGKFVRSGGRQAVFVLVEADAAGHGREIIITRKDVNEIQLAKGAIRSGIDILLQEARIPPEAIDDCIIAGAFGTHLDLASAVRVGMFPALPFERFHQVGNAAGVGAKEMLLSLDRRAEAAQIAAGVRYIELTTHPNFTPTYVDALYFHPAGTPSENE